VKFIDLNKKGLEIISRLENLETLIISNSYLPEDAAAILSKCSQLHTLALNGTNVGKDVLVYRNWGCAIGGCGLRFAGHG
jgi:hypothetical protein